MDKFLAILQDLTNQNCKYADPDFPAEDKSIIGDGSNRMAMDWINGRRPCNLWKRPDDFYGENKHKLFFDKIEP